MSFSSLMGWSPVKPDTVDISFARETGQGFFDPNSSMNRGLYDQSRRMGIDSAAQMGLSNFRMGAAGQNPFAGGQNRATFADAQNGAMQSWRQGLQSNYGVGSGLLSMAMQGDASNAQATNMARMGAAQNKSDFFGGLFSSALQASPFALFGFPGGGNGQQSPRPRRV